MLTLMKLARSGKRSLPHVHFARILGHIGEELLRPDTLSHLSESDQFACKYLAENLVRKHSGVYGLPVKSPEELSSLTWQGFIAQERQNAIFNSHVDFGYSAATGEFSSDLLGDNLLYECRDLIALILGDKPNIDAIVERSFFGNGASATLSRSCAQDTEKYLPGLSSTRNLLNFATKVVSSSHIWGRTVQADDPVMYVSSTGVSQTSVEHITVCNSSVYDEVPKDARINRVIMKEPELNGYFQHGVGAEIRSLLGRRRDADGLPGVNLNESGTANALLACEGSITGLWATVDASRASDSITLALCELLLPPAWYNLLLIVRTPYVTVPGKGMLKLDMMSGMGNGFTFELESLIFYAIGYVCAKRSVTPFAEYAVSVHGDDLIVPSDVMGLVQACYDAAGLIINTDKSFASGPFRESCGGHFFLGESVKPFYVKTQNGLRRGDWFWLYNSLLLWISDRKVADPEKDLSSLYTLLKHIGWYASSGKPHLWLVPSSRSRRSGLFSEAPKLHRRTHWKVRMIVDQPTSVRSSDAGRYVRWHDRAERLPTVLELCQKRDSSDKPWDSTVETVEIEKYVRLTSWHNLCTALLPCPFGGG